jgi:hypothetical protein
MNDSLHEDKIMHDGEFCDGFSNEKRRAVVVTRDVFCMRWVGGFQSMTTQTLIVNGKGTIKVNAETIAKRP